VLGLGQVNCWSWLPEQLSLDGREYFADWSLVIVVADKVSIRLVQADAWVDSPHLG